jgi:hypothetical protein
VLAGYKIGSKTYLISLIGTGLRRLVVIIVAERLLVTYKVIV